MADPNYLRECQCTYQNHKPNYPPILFEVSFANIENYANQVDKKIFESQNQEFNIIIFKCVLFGIFTEGVWNPNFEVKSKALSGSEIGDRFLVRTTKNEIIPVLFMGVWIEVVNDPNTNTIRIELPIKLSEDPKETWKKILL